MFIGDIVAERMKALGMDFKQVLEYSLIEKDILKGIINNELSLSEISYTDLEFLASTIRCPVEYFLDEIIREKNRLTLDDKNTIQSNIVKANIQCLMEDFAFINKINKESY